MEDISAAAGRQQQQQHGDDDAEASSALLSSPHPPRASLGLETPCGGSDETEEELATARRCLYASHFLSAWGARAWEFTAGLALFFPAGGGGGGGGVGGASAGGLGGGNDASLSLVAALGLAQQAAQALSGPYLGREVDRLPRLAAARRVYGLQAAGTLASALFVLLARRAAAGESRGGGGGAAASPLVVYLLGSLAALFAALAAVGASGATLSVEREWTQALAKEGREARERRSLRPRLSSSGGGGGGEKDGESDESAEVADASSPSSSSALLASINASMRRIDLACLLASPGVAGLLLSRLGAEAAVAAIALYGCCAWAPQAWLLRRAVRAAPSRLREREGERERKRTAAAAEGGEEEEAPPSSSPSPLAAYVSADSFAPAFALALLYLTVLSFGPLATAYLNWRGLGEVELAAWRGVGAAAGIAATAAFPRLRSGLGADAAGALGIGSQFLCLLVGCLAAFVPPPQSSSSSAAVAGSAFSSPGGKSGGGSGVGGARLLAASLALSRFGLWLFDLSASQGLQERVPRGQLGAVNGVQSALQAALGALSFAAALAVPSPAHFWVLGLGSLGAVSLALAVCVSGQAALRRREHGRAERERAARREIGAAAAAAATTA